MKPFWILRHHGSNSIRCMHYDHDLLAVGDEVGKVSLVDLKTLRPTWSWKAHQESLLTVIVVSKQRVLTHGRDNKLHLWDISSQPETDLDSLVGANKSLRQHPALLKTVEVNALNFAKCSFFNGSVAVPNVLDAAYIDVIHLESGKRINEAIGRPDILPRGGNRQPIVMSLHLMQDSVIAGYEDGWVRRWDLNGDLTWETRCHSESVMSTALSKSDFGISVGADDRIAKFDIATGRTHISETKSAGKACIAIAPNNLTFAVGGWDGFIRLYASETLKQLGSLSYHRDTVDCLQVCPSIATVSRDTDSDSEEDTNIDETKPGQSPVTTLAAGGRDGKISLWRIF